MMIPGTQYGINWVISGALFLLFGLTCLIKRSMAKKRLELEEDRRSRLLERPAAAEPKTEEDLEREAREAIELASTLHIEEEKQP